jgi:hypothetical protein
MSMTNDYIVDKLARQRQQDLLAEAALRRLANEAPSDNRSWWRRLTKQQTPLLPRRRRQRPARNASGGTRS